VTESADFPWEYLGACVKRLDNGRAPRSIEAMPGGASTRRFVRVHLESGQSAVAMYFPEADKSEELTKPDAKVDRWPFLQVHDVLRACGVRVPTVLGEDCDHGLLLVEDLGHDTLANYLERVPESRQDLYRIAIRDLVKAQSAFRDIGDSSIVRRRAFDFDLLRWEIDHFREWALEAQGIRLTASESKAFEQAATHIARQAADWPRVFVHRDYQSRNLMVRQLPNGHELVWIDFQDALLGPRVYDLVALLNDSYQAFTSDFIDECLMDYVRLSGLGRQEFAQIHHEFDWMTVQRKLKDAGRFVFIDRAKGNPSFLRFVLPTMAKVRVALANLKRDPILRALADCFDVWFERIRFAGERASH
jgi:aminoglycoside/choline kinase family phosphotransferase